MAPYFKGLNVPRTPRVVAPSQRLTSTQSWLRPKESHWPLSASAQLLVFRSSLTHDCPLNQLPVLYFLVRGTSKFPVWTETRWLPRLSDQSYLIGFVPVSLALSWSSNR